MIVWLRGSDSSILWSLMSHKVSFLTFADYNKKHTNFPWLPCYYCIFRNCLVWYQSDLASANQVTLPTFALAFIFKIASPTIAAMNEEIRILILEDTMVSGSVKARLHIKMLIVNPIPPRNAMPKICLHRKSEDSLASFILTARNDRPKIPINFPITRPRIIPQELSVVNPERILSGKIMAVLARANMGRITNATG